MSGPRNICARCGWHWFKHGSKNQCPNMPRNADGSKPRYLRLTPPAACPDAPSTTQTGDLSDV